MGQDVDHAAVGIPAEETAYALLAMPPPEAIARAIAFAIGQPADVM